MRDNCCQQMPCHKDDNSIEHFLKQQHSYNIGLGICRRPRIDLENIAIPIKVSHTCPRNRLLRCCLKNVCNDNETAR